MVELHPWQLHVLVEIEREMILRSIFNWLFHQKSKMSLQSNQVEAEVKLGASEVQQKPQPTFRSHPNMSSNYNFEDEVQQLPFKFNLRDASFNREQ